MSNRSMLEINHDYTPANDCELMEWARSFRMYLSSGDPSVLPRGVTWFGQRHHTEPCPMGEPPAKPKD
jgi:hypothetical protein